MCWVIPGTRRPEDPIAPTPLRREDIFCTLLSQGAASSRTTDYRTWLTSLRAKLVHQLKATLYTVEEEAEVGVIFEVLNNRGKPLSELEKVKNYLLYLASKLQLPNQLATRVNEAWTNISERLMEAHMTESVDENQLLRSHWLMAYDFSLSNWDGSRSIKHKYNLKEYVGEALLALLQELLDYTRISGGRFISVLRCPEADPDEGLFQARRSAQSYAKK